MPRKKVEKTTDVETKVAENADVAEVTAEIEGAAVENGDNADGDSSNNDATDDNTAEEKPLETPLINEEISTPASPDIPEKIPEPVTEEETEIKEEEAEIKGEEYDLTEFGGGETQVPVEVVAEVTNEDSATIPSASTPQQQQARAPRQRILTADVGGEVKTQQDLENEVWHELKNSHIRRDVLTGTLSMIEIFGDTTLCVIDYKGQRVVIPLKEMGITAARIQGQSNEEHRTRVNMMLNRMMGAKIDFIVRGLDESGIERAAVASRNAATLRNRERFYINKRPNGLPLVYARDEGYEARIIAVGERSLRVDVFGVETSIGSGDVSWEAIRMDLRDKFFVGDTVLVRVKDVTGDTAAELRVRVSIKELLPDRVPEKLNSMKRGNRCIGTVTDADNGIFFIALSNGLLGVAHKCHDRRKPGRGDKVDFVVRDVDLVRRSVTGDISKITKREI